MASDGYTPAHQRWHWLSVGLMLTILAIGYTISDHKGRASQIVAYDWHKWLGLTLLVLTAMRLAYRLARPVAEADDIAPMERLGSKLVHVALYLLMFVVPVIGWVSSNMLGFPVVLFNLIPTPYPFGQNHPMGFLLLDIHVYLAWALTALIVLHAAAALWHHAVKRDSVLGRMLPELKRPKR
jgi:cytochrome b561